MRATTPVLTPSVPIRRALPWALAVVLLAGPAAPSAPAEPGAAPRHPFVGGEAPPTPRPQVGPDDPFLSSFEAAERAAGAADRPLLVVATAAWCPPCRHMDRTTWRNPVVRELLDRHVVGVKIDWDRDPELRRRLRIHRLPTLILLKDGREVDRRIGYLDSTELLAWLRSLLRRGL